MMIRARRRPTRVLMHQGGMGGRAGSAGKAGVGVIVGEGTGASVSVGGGGVSVSVGRGVQVQVVVQVAVEVDVEVAVGVRVKVGNGGVLVRVAGGGGGAVGTVCALAVPSQAGALPATIPTASTRPAAMRMRGDRRIAPWSMVSSLHLPRTERSGSGRLTERGIKPTMPSP
jgi:hypothetical protein